MRGFWQSSGGLRRGPDSGSPPAAAMRSGAAPRGASGARSHTGRRSSRKICGGRGRAAPRTGTLRLAAADASHGAPGRPGSVPARTASPRHRPRRTARRTISLTAGLYGSRPVRVSQDVPFHRNTRCDRSRKIISSAFPDNASYVPSFMVRTWFQASQRVL